MPKPSSSLWAATADPGPETPPLAGAHGADVVVIGAGFTGLTAALRLAEGGASVIVLDSVEPGFGASGRNGGQVIPGLKEDPDTLDALYGEATTDFVGKAADVVFSLVKRWGIACDPSRKGWIQASLKTSHLPVLERRMRQWLTRGAEVARLDAAEMAQKTGGVGFVGGRIDRRGGSVHPLNYVRGLTRAALAAGAKIHGDSAVTKLKRSGRRWIAECGSRASVVADHAIIATNGYTDALWPHLKATVIPANSLQIATAPLGPKLLDQILPGRSVASDSRRVGNYFRIGAGGRLVMGGRGVFSDPRSPDDYRRIVAALRAFFPAAGALPIEYCWAGRVAMTVDHLPHLHQPFPSLTIALGYNGRGVALASAVGDAIGAHLLDRSKKLPLKITEIKPMPAHGLHPVYAAAMIAYYRLRDALER